MVWIWNGPHGSLLMCVPKLAVIWGDCMCVGLPGRSRSLGLCLWRLHPYDLFGHHSLLLCNHMATASVTSSCLHVLSFPATMDWNPEKKSIFLPWLVSVGHYCCSNIKRTTASSKGQQRHFELSVLCKRQRPATSIGEPHNSAVQQQDRPLTARSLASLSQHSKSYTVVLL